MDPHRPVRIRAYAVRKSADIQTNAPLNEAGPRASPARSAWCTKSPTISIVYAQASHGEPRNEALIAADVVASGVAQALPRVDEPVPGVGTVERPSMKKPASVDGGWSESDSAQPNASARPSNTAENTDRGFTSCYYRSRAWGNRRHRQSSAHLAPLTSHWSLHTTWSPTTRHRVAA